MEVTASQQLAYALTVLCIYLVCVRYFRFQRRDAVLKEFPTRQSFGQMTVVRAHKIRFGLAAQEFPSAFTNGTFFALFKTYGIPSISKLLVQTGQLADETTASKRIADTGVLLTEFAFHHPAEVRAIESIARMNFLHSRYQKTGKISNDDMLYTLSLFALEPSRWINRYEWRKVTDVEACAIGQYWHYMAGVMNITLDPLQSYPTWKDGLQWLDDLEKWSIEYEAKAMVFAETNKMMAKGTLDAALYNVPSMMHKSYHSVVSALLGSRVTIAMGLSTPPAWAGYVLTTVMSVRQVIILYFCFPRPYFMRKNWCSDELNAHGKYNAQDTVSLPWYMAPTMANRWGPKALFLRSIGRKVAGADGDRYEPQGYTILDLGPDKLKGKGRDEMAESCASIRATQQLHCPFSMQR